MMSFMKLSIFALSLMVLCLRVESWIIRLTCKTEADFSIGIENFKLTNSLITQISTRDQEECVVECIRHDKCKSFNYKREGVDENCELNGNIKENTEENFKAETGWIYFSTDYNTTKIGSVCESLSPCGAQYCADACNSIGYTCFECDKPNRVLSIEPFCKEEGPKNLALRKTTIGPAEVFKGRSLSLANDGIVTIHKYGSCFTSMAKEPWWMVDLGAPAVIEKIFIWSVHKEFTVDVSAGRKNTNRGADNIICAKDVKLLLNQRNDFSCPVFTIAQYVSVIANYRIHLRLCEVEVHGTYEQI